MQLEFDEKRFPISKQFLISYEKIKEYKPQYKLYSSELAIEKKVLNKLKSLLKQK